MTRTLGLLSLVLALGIAGYLLSAQLRSAGPTSPSASRAGADAANEVATLNLQQAAPALEQFRAANGTYLGADLGGFGVRAVRADATSYCVQTLRSPLSHLAGPGGMPAAGAC